MGRRRRRRAPHHRGAASSDRHQPGGQPQTRAKLVEGQGRGQIGDFIGGEQARISREAAIQALPIQAQLATAQADLDSARSYASQLFQAQSQDAERPECVYL